MSPLSNAATITPICSCAAAACFPPAPPRIKRWRLPPSPWLW